MPDQLMADAPPERDTEVEVVPGPTKAIMAHSEGVPYARQPGIPGTVSPTSGKVTPFTIEEQANPWIGIAAHAANIHNPIARTAARMGAIMAAGLSATGQGEAGTAEAAKEIEAQRGEKLAQERLDQQDEIANQRISALEDRIKASEDIAKENIMGRQNVANTQAGAKVESANIAAAAKPTHTMEDLKNAARAAFNTGDMDLYKQYLGEMQDITKATSATAGTKPRQEVTLQLPDGKRTAGFKGPEGLMLESGEKAPDGTLLYQAATTGQTRTTTIFNPQTGFDEVMQYNPDTGRYDIPAGVSGQGQQGSRMSAAAAGQRAADDLIKEIKAHKDELGSLTTWVEKYGLDTPIADPDLAGIQASVASYAALQPVIHGFRGTNALDTFEKIIGGLQKDPDATIASIQGMQGITKAILPPKETPAASSAGTPGQMSVADWLKNRKK